MKLFDKRPLALILCITVGGFVIFSFSSETLRLILLISAALLGLFALVFLRGRPSRTLVSSAAAALLISMLFSDVYFNHYFKLTDDFTDEVEIEAVVYDVEYRDYTATLLFETRKIDGENINRRLVGYINKSETNAIGVGSVVVFTSVLRDFDADTRSYYYSRGFCASVGEIENLTVISQNEAPIASRLSDFRQMLMRRAILLSDYDTGAVTAALLLGERSYLGGNISLDFKSCGLSHVLALSGMHLSILAAGLAFFFSAIGINKKWRTLAVIIITLLYMALTGFSASITRAGIMLIISSVLFLLSSTHDALTSLALSLFLIILFTPYSIYDISLWLSAFATLGIIAFSELKVFKTKSKRLGIRLLSFVLRSLLASVFAIGATLPFTALVFGTLSPLGPLSTLIFSIPAEIIMYLGGAMLLIGDIIPIGIILSPIVKGMLYLVNAMANLPGALSSSVFPEVTVLVLIFTAIFFLYLILNIKHKRIALSVIVALYASVFLSSQFMTVAAKSTDGIVYLGDNSSDAFIIKSDSNSCLVDSSSQKTSVSYSWLDGLYERGMVELDKYYLTHYSKRSEGTVETVVSSIRTRELCLPTPQNEDEEKILKALKKLTEKYKITLTLIEPDSELKIGSFALRQLYGVPYGEGTSMTALAIEANGKSHLYLSSGMYEGKTKSLSLEVMSESYTVIFGRHGRKYSETIYFDKRFNKIWTIILGSNDLTLTDSAWEYYEKSGGEIYISPTAIDILR